MPGKPFQSKLEPFHEFIRECRVKRWSYCKIAEALGSEHGLSVSANAVFSFVKVRTKHRKLYALPPAPVSPPPSLDRNLTGQAAGFFTPSQSSKKPLPHENKSRPYNI